jgi:hypothetical protein
MKMATSSTDLYKVENIRNLWGIQKRRRGRVLVRGFTVF